MLIDVTDLHDCAELLAASQAEIGADAGAITWANALRKAREMFPDITGEMREAARDHVESFGAWEREEIIGWCDYELMALVLQMAAGEIREAERAGVMDGEDYRNAREIGQVSGRLRIDDLGMTVHYDFSD